MSGFIHSLRIWDIVLLLEGKQLDLVLWCPTDVHIFLINSPFSTVSLLCLQGTLLANPLFLQMTHTSAGASSDGLH